MAKNKIRAAFEAECGVANFRSEALENTNVVVHMEDPIKEYANACSNEEP